MRFYACFLGVLVASVGLHAADLSEQDLQKARDQIAGGKMSDATQTFRRLLARKETTDEVWEQVIRLQMDGGLLSDAARNAETLARRSAQTPPKAAHQKLLQEVMGKHVKELDRILAMKTWGDVGQDDNDFCRGVPKILRRAVGVDRTKAEAAFRRAYELIQQCPDELNHREVGRPGGPSSTFLSYMGSAPGLMGPVLEMADRAGLTRNRDWLDLYYGQLLNSDEMRDPNYVLSIFNGTPMVAEAGEFRDLSLPGVTWETLMGKLTALLLEDWNRDLKRVLLNDLAARKARTFGVELVECLLDDDVLNQKMKGFLKHRRADLGRLNDEAACTMVALLSTRFYGISSPAPLDGELVELLGPLLESETWHLDSVRFTWQQTSEFDELKLDSQSAVAVATHISKRLAVRDPMQAQTFMDQALRLFRSAADRESTTMTKTFLQQVASVPELLAVVMKAAEREGLTQEGDWLLTTMSRAWRPGDHVGQPQRLITFLEAAGVLGDARSFTANWRTDEPHEKGFVKRIQSSFAASPSAAKVFLPILEARQPRTFGADVVQAVLKPGIDQSLLKVALQYRAELESLPADRQAEAARFFTLWVRDLETLAKGVPGLALSLKMHLTAKGESALQEVERIAQARTVNELAKDGASQDPTLRAGRFMPPNATSSVMAGAIEAIATAHAKDPKKAAEAFKNFTRLVQTDDQRGLPGARLQSGMLGEWLVTAADHPFLLPLVRDELKGSSQSPDQIWVQRVEERMFPVTDFADARNAVRLMEKYGLLVEAGSFDPLSLAPGRHQLELAVRRIRGMAADSRAEAATLLQSRVPATFGSVLMAAMCQGTGEAANTILAARETDLGRLPGLHKQMILQSLFAVFPAIMRDQAVAPRTGAVGLLLAHEDQLERQYLESLRSSTVQPPSLTPLRGTTVVAGAELEKLLDQGDRAAATAFFDQMMQRTSSRSHTEPYMAAVFYSNPGAAQTRIQGLIRSRTNARMVGYVLNRMLADDTERLGAPGPTFATLGAASLEASWLDAGGWASPAAAVEVMLKSLAQGMGDAPVVSASPVLGGFLKLLPGPCRREVLQWASTCDPASPVHSLARELVTVGALQAAIKAGDPQAVVKEWQHYADAMNTESTRKGLQFGLAAYWCQQAPWLVPSSISIPGAKIAVDYWRRDQPAPVVEMASVFESFAASPEDPGWRPVAEAFASEWKARNLAAKDSRTRMVLPDATHASLGVLARLGDDACLDLFTEVQKSSLDQELWPVGVLARQGRTERAARHLVQGWSKMTRQSASQYRESSAGPLAGQEALAAFAGAFRDGERDLALLGEFAMLADGRPRGESADARTMALWEQLMASFAGRVAATPVTEPRVRRVLHSLMVQASPRQLGRLAACVAEDARQGGSELSRYQPQSPEAWAVDPLAMVAAGRVLAGEVDVVSKDLQLISAAWRTEPSSSSWNRSGASGQYLLRLLDCLSADWASMTDERQKAVMEVIAGELAAAGQANSASSSDLELVRWMVDCWQKAGGKPPLPTTGSRGTSRLFGQSFVLAKAGLVRLAAAGEGQRRPSLEFRTRLFVAAMKKPEFQVGLASPSTTISSLLAGLPLLTPEEAVSVGSSLISDLGQGGKVGYELAAMAFDLGREKDALAMIELAAGEGDSILSSANASSGSTGGYVPSPGLGRDKEMIPLRKAALLIRLGREKEAVDALKKVPDDSTAPGKKALMKLAEAALGTTPS